MNDNLMRLKALVKETNEVVANLENEIGTIEDDNQVMRAEKFNNILSYLMDCYEIVKELGVSVSIPINVNVRYLMYPATTYIKINHNLKGTKYPITFSYDYVNYNRGTNGHEDETTYGLDSETKWDPDKRHQYFFGCWWKTEDEKFFVDNWDQDEFEKQFAAKIEEAITKKASDMNDKYNHVTNNTRLLQERK